MVASLPGLTVSLLPHMPSTSVEMACLYILSVARTFSTLKLSLVDSADNSAHLSFCNCDYKKACNNLVCIIYLWGICFSRICSVASFSSTFLQFCFFSLNCQKVPARSKLPLPILEFGNYIWILILLKIHYMGFFLPREGQMDGRMQRQTEKGEK